MQKYNDKPETMSQAVNWDKRFSAYERAGFCFVCAAQAAWGHQLGFSRVRPVCPDCCGGTVPDPRRDRAVRWADGRPQPEDDPAVCRDCGSPVSGPDVWGDEWGGSCDRAEARAKALTDAIRGLSVGI